MRRDAYALHRLGLGVGDIAERLGVCQSRVSALTREGAAIAMARSARQRRRDAEAQRQRLYAYAVALRDGLDNSPHLTNAARTLQAMLDREHGKGAYTVQVSNG